MLDKSKKKMSANLFGTIQTEENLSASLFGNIQTEEKTDKKEVREKSVTDKNDIAEKLFFGNDKLFARYENVSFVDSTNDANGKHVFLDDQEIDLTIEDGYVTMTSLTTALGLSVTNANGKKANDEQHIDKIRRTDSLTDVNTDKNAHYEVSPTDISGDVINENEDLCSDRLVGLTKNKLKTFQKKDCNHHIYEDIAPFMHPNKRSHSSGDLMRSYDTIDEATKGRRITITGVFNTTSASLNENEVRHRKRSNCVTLKANPFRKMSSPE